MVWSRAERGGEDQSFSASLADGATLRIHQIHVAGPGKTTIGSAEWKVKQTQSRSQAGVELSVGAPANAQWAQPIGSFILNCNEIRNLSLWWVLKLTGCPMGDFLRFDFADP